MLFKDLLLLQQLPAQTPYYAQLYLGATARDINATRQTIREIEESLLFLFPRIQPCLDEIGDHTAGFLKSLGTFNNPRRPEDLGRCH